MNEPKGPTSIYHTHASILSAYQVSSRHSKCFSLGEKEYLSPIMETQIYFITQKYNLQKIPLKQKPQILHYFITNLKSSFQHKTT